MQTGSENIPQENAIGHLRLHYRAAIAALDAAVTALQASYRAPARTGAELELRHVRRAARDDALVRELAAGRAFLAALDLEQPCCVRCGCSACDPCPEGCGWAETDGEPVCTACEAKTEVTA